MTAPLNSTYSHFHYQHDGQLVRVDSKPLDPEIVLGRTISRWTTYAGTYGMGGPGFLGFLFEGEPEEWLIVGVWGAVEWLRLDGEVVGLPPNIFTSSDPPGWYRDLFVGDALVALHVERQALTATLRSGRTLLLADDPPLPSFGNGEPRTFTAEDDLRTAAIVVPTPSVFFE
ncbi:MAG: hypothetical protein QOF21_174 [Actinomycetota bacterium]